MTGCMGTGTGYAKISNRFYTYPTGGPEGKLGGTPLIPVASPLKGGVFNGRSL